MFRPLSQPSSPVTRPFTSKFLIVAPAIRNGLNSFALSVHVRSNRPKFAAKANENRSGSKVCQWHSHSCLPAVAGLCALRTSGHGFSHAEKESQKTTPLRLPASFLEGLFTRSMWCVRAVAVPLTGAIVEQNKDTEPKIYPLSFLSFSSQSRTRRVEFLPSRRKHCHLQKFNRGKNRIFGVRKNRKAAEPTHAGPGRPRSRHRPCRPRFRKATADPSPGLQSGSG
jgi:hypothetical protein